MRLLDTRHLPCRDGGPCTIALDAEQIARWPHEDRRDPKTRIDLGIFEQSGYGAYGGYADRLDWRGTKTPIGETHHG